MLAGGGLSVDWKSPVGTAEVNASACVRVRCCYRAHAEMGCKARVETFGPLYSLIGQRKRKRSSKQQVLDAQ